MFYIDCVQFPSKVSGLHSLKTASLQNVNTERKQALGKQGSSTPHLEQQCEHLPCLQACLCPSFGACKSRLWFSLTLAFEAHPSIWLNPSQMVCSSSLSPSLPFILLFFLLVGCDGDRARLGIGENLILSSFCTYQKWQSKIWKMQLVLIALLYGLRKRWSHWRETELWKFLVLLYEGEGAQMGRNRPPLSRTVMLDRLG